MTSSFCSMNPSFAGNTDLLNGTCNFKGKTLVQHSNRPEIFNFKLSVVLAPRKSILDSVFACRSQMAPQEIYYVRRLQHTPNQLTYTQPTSVHISKRTWCLAYFLGCVGLIVYTNNSQSQWLMYQAAMIAHIIDWVMFLQREISSHKKISTQ